MFDNIVCNISPVILSMEGFQISIWALFHSYQHHSQYMWQWIIVSTSSSSYTASLFLQTLCQEELSRPPHFRPDSNNRSFYNLWYPLLPRIHCHTTVTSPDSSLMAIFLKLCFFQRSSQPEDLVKLLFLLPLLCRNGSIRIKYHLTKLTSASYLKLHWAQSKYCDPWNHF